MKKRYEKPFIYMENMELTEHIASCAFVFKNQSDPTSCAAEGKNPYEGDEVPTISVFLDSTKDCNAVEPEGFCVYVSENSGATFIS